MILELAALPTVFQQYIQENPSLEIKLVDGKVITTPKLVERPFNFDIEEMDKAINSKFVTMPAGLAKDPEAFEKWLKTN